MYMISSLLAAHEIIVLINNVNGTFEPIDFNNNYKVLSYYANGRYF